MVIRQIKVRSRDQEVMTYVPASRCGLKRAPSSDQPDSGVPVFQRKAHLGIGQDREEADSTTPAIHQGKLPNSTLLELKTSFLLLVLKYSR